MKALFIVTRTNDCLNHLSAWESFAGPAEIIRHTPNGNRNDILILEKAKAVRPRVIFYIGAVRGTGIPETATFYALRRVAPLVLICSDAADKIWQDALLEYRKQDCFDLTVSIDGAGTGFADHVTVTPVDPRFFADPAPARDIRCGFSGGWGSRHALDYDNHGAAYRGRVIHVLEKHGLLTARRREPTGPYQAHIDFVRRCQVLLNVSLAGDGVHHQVKGRVLEAGWAGCALLESAGSPAIDLYPPDSLFVYENLEQALEILRTASDAEIATKAARLASHTRTHYHPARIYGAILEKLDSVGFAEPWPTAKHEAPDSGVECHKSDIGRASAP